MLLWVTPKSVSSRSKMQRENLYLWGKHRYLLSEQGTQVRHPVRSTSLTLYYYNVVLDGGAGKQFSFSVIIGMDILFTIFLIGFCIYFYKNGGWKI